MKTRNFLATFALVLVAVLTFAPAALAESNCGAARAELIDSVPFLPQTLDELSNYTVTERKVLTAELAPETRSNLWRTQLRGYLAEHPEASAAQRRVVEYAIELASPDLFTIAPDDFLHEALVDKPIEGLAVVASKVFTDEEIRTLFLQLGAGDPATSSRGDNKWYACSCRVGWNGCGDLWYCGGLCDQTSGGCGWFGAQACDGLCQPRH